MDIISYGIANKASKSEKTTRNDVLGQGVEGTHPHARGRIEAMEEGIQKVVGQADKLIINDTVNIMKAHAKFNAVAKSAKYKMHNMVFDDLLDLSGIDTVKSSGYTHDATEGSTTAGADCVIETKEETTDMVVSKIILTAEKNGDGSFFASRDNGETWESVEPDALFHFKDSISPLGNQLRLKFELSNGAKLLNYALTWA
jgi:hypothetical protein